MNAPKMMPFVQNDGGRAAAGFTSKARDCVARSIAIASGLDYIKVYDALAVGTGTQRGKPRAFSASHGINVKRAWFKKLMAEWGFTWTPTMGIGTGCKVHLVANELPAGRLVVAVSKHYTAVIDGVIHDASDPQWHTCFTEKGSERVAARCVYGYWTFNGEGQR